MSEASSKSKSAIRAWSFYDFANSAFTTLIVTFVYSTFFASKIAPDYETGLTMWANAITASALIIAALSPFFGAMADRGGYRKRFLGISTIVCIVATVLLFFPQEGDVLFALTVFVIANVAFEMGLVFYNAFLPEISTADNIGSISGNGWALGYLGGLLCMALGLFVLIRPDPPLFGMNAETGEHVRATTLLVAGWFALFSIPTFLFLNDRPVANPPPMRRLMVEAYQDVKRVFAEVKEYRQVFRLLLARLIYNDGLVTIFGFGGIYAMDVFGFTIDEVLMFGITLNLAAGLGAWALGFLDDRWGGKTTIYISLVGLIAATMLAVFTQSTMWFWIAGIGIGLLAGPMQSASRSLLGRFTPESKENEFFGFFAFSGKATAFMGPILIAQLSATFGSMRFGIAVVVAFFVVGGILLMRVDEAEGIAASGRS